MKKHPFLPEKYVERLKQLRRVVAAVPRRRFDLNIIARKSGCGTVGCAFGHAGLDPWFRRRGLCTTPDLLCGNTSFRGKLDPVRFFTPPKCGPEYAESLQVLFYSDGGKVRTLNRIDRLLAGKYL